MKNIIIMPAVILLLWTGAGIISNGQEFDYGKYIGTDSALVYKWSLTLSDWEPSQVQLYGYTDGKLTEILTKDFATGNKLARSVYAYNDLGRMESATNYSFSGSWILSTRALYEYDYIGRASLVRVQKWTDGAWSEDRLQQNYVYDLNDKLTGYETIYWRSGAWTMPTVSVLNYNDPGKLESRIATRPDGNIDYRIIYEYNDRGVQTQFYTQYPAGSGWSNWNLRTFEYNNCGRKSAQVQYSGEGPDWIPYTRTEFFESFREELYPYRKIAICHNGHTIRVAVQAVDAHLRHGDCIGECLDEQEKRGPEQFRNPPFSVFPNPAKERFTVRFDRNDECNVNTIELADFNGRIVKTWTVRENSDLVIERGKLNPGYYYIRLKGDQVFSQLVVFE
jgi:hypothetical protein